MTIKEFRKKIKPYMRLSIEGKDFLVQEVVKFRFDDGTFYIKCFLDNGYAFADDSSQNIFLLVKEIKTLFAQPFSEELEFDTKKFKFLYSAHAVAEETIGRDIFIRGNGESFWDYKSEDNSYLSLGIADGTEIRSDFYGWIIDNNLIEINAGKI